MSYTVICAICVGIFLIIIIVNIVQLKIYYKDLEHNLDRAAFKNTSREAFTASNPELSESKPWPLSGNIGFKPLIISNLSGNKLSGNKLSGNKIPIYKLGVSNPGSISYIVGQYLQRKIYPVILKITPSNIIIRSKLTPNPVNNSALDIGFVRESHLLELARKESGIKSLSVLAPAYWETFYLIGSKYTPFSALIEAKQNTTTLATTNIITRTKIGVLTDSIPFWNAIIKAHDMEIGRDFIQSENTNLAQLLEQLDNKLLDAVFMVTHTFDSRLQAFLKTNEVKMISIYPLKKYPLDTNMLTNPYNPETTDLIAKFNSDIKIYVPWIFNETVTLGAVVRNSSTRSSGSSIYKTFKIRSYLCVNTHLGKDNNFINMIGRKYLEEYQTLGLLINEWGNRNTSPNKSNVVKELMLPAVVFTDYDSFNPDALGAIPHEIEINPIMRNLIANIYGRIKIENGELSCDI